MVNWQKLIKTYEELELENAQPLEDEWRQEAAESVSELYYETYRSNGRGATRRIDHRPGSDFQRFLASHMAPLGKYGVWEALFPNKLSATSAGAIDEALHLLADTKLVDCVYSGDIITVNKIISNVRKKRAKYIEQH